jgi:glucose/arabinose dehydrogenase
MKNYYKVTQSFIRIIAQCISVLIFFSSCGQSTEKLPITGSNNTTGSTASTSITGLPPVETQAAISSGQKPAFEGQYRVQGIKTTSNVKITSFASGLRQPWGLDFLPDGRMIVSEKFGNIRLVSKTGTLSNPIQNVPAVRLMGDGGMYDVKLDPDFATSRLVFWCFVEAVTGGGVTSVARAKLSADETRFDDLKIIYRASPVYSGPNHNGSRMLFDKQGNLFVSFGERFDDEIRKKAQDLSSSLGKIIRIDKDGKAVAGNPFEKTEGALPEIYSLGHRNPQGLAFHPTTGDLWSSDHGPNAGDEVNIIKPGLNYGWPTISYGIEYSGRPVNGGLTQQTGMEQPIYYYDPAVAPSGINFYTGNLISEWKGNLFMATLRGMHIVRLVIKDNKIIGEERLFSNLGERFRYIIQGPDEALYTITDSPSGRIYRISL